MIKEDVNGIFFSIDAGLALIPVFILLLTVIIRILINSFLPGKTYFYEA